MAQRDGIVDKVCIGKGFEFKNRNPDAAQPGFAVICPLDVLLAGTSLIEKETAERNDLIPAFTGTLTPSVYGRN